jgi:hypothetical protein
MAASSSAQIYASRQQTNQRRRGRASKNKTVLLLLFRGEKRAKSRLLQFTDHVNDIAFIYINSDQALANMYPAHLVRGW